MNNIIREFNSDNGVLMDIVEVVQSKRRDVDYDMDKNAICSVAKNNVLIQFKDGMCILEADMPSVIEKGTYSYFDFICAVKFKNNVVSTLTWLQYEWNSDTLPYICVGTDYYKVITKSDRYNIKRTKLKLWKMTEIKPFHGKDIIYDIPRYDDFCLEPNNIDYEPIVDNCYNQHSEFSHQPDIYGGSYKWTKQLLEHVFGEQIEEGMQYLQCLYMYPKQALPILVLVSEERQTGKSTFIDWLTVLFGENMVVANPKDIGSDFNSSYADKNIIGIEESRFDSVQTTEKLKNLATQKKILVNPKHQQPYSLPFFGKLIITSNDENKFSKVDDKEIRYWVRKVPSLVGKANHNILDDMVREIPNFLHELLALPDLDFSKSRMLFSADQIQTEALDVVKQESKSQLYKEIYDLFEDIFANNDGLKFMEFIPKDIKDRWYSHNNNIGTSYIRSVLAKEFNIKAGSNRRYSPMDTDSPMSAKRTGRAYKIEREYFRIEEPRVDDTWTEEDENTFM